MSKCMTIDDIIKKESTDHIEVESLLAAKEVVGCILEEALHSAVIDSGRGCMIGDFTEDFSQQFGQVSLSESTSSNLTDELPTVCDNVSNPDRQIVEKSEPLNLGSDEKGSDVKVCRVIEDHALEDNELRFENGSIRLLRNKSVKPIDELRNEYFSKEDIIKDETIEIEYFNGEKFNKIYVPVKKNSSENQSSFDVQNMEGTADNDMSLTNDKEAPFSPISSEKLRQSLLQAWENANPPTTSGWDGDALNQPKEIMKMMEKLSGLQVIPIDPNRPRAYTLAEEEVKKMIKEIEDINFNNQCCVSTGNSESYTSTGQGDFEVDMESKMHYENLEESAESCDFNPDENLLNSEALVNTTFIQEEQLETHHADDSFVHVDVNLNEAANLKSSYTLESYKSWMDEDQDFHIESEMVESLPVLEQSTIDPYEADSSQVFATQKFAETYDFNESDGMIEMPLTISNEDLMNNSESLIQVIEPTEEEPVKISFSLLNEFEFQDYYKEEDLTDLNYDIPLNMNLERKLRDSDIIDPIRVKSGMTTVGPMKNLDRDPRDLSGPEIDFGKMTLISESQKIGQPCHSYDGFDQSVVVVCESDKDVTEIDGRLLTTETLINRDITSFTRLQKVKEAISHQQKSVQDITSESLSGNDRLDLKDIESATDNRYTDLSGGITSYEIEAAETHSNEIDVFQRIPLEVKESPEQASYFAENPSKNSDPNRNIHVYGRSSPVIAEQMSDEKLVKAQSAKTILKNKKEENTILNFMDGTQKDMETRYSLNPEAEEERVFHFNENVQSDSVVNKKHNTISNVFRKASNKFMRKDSDSFLRNAKSLPRDTSKLHFSLSGAESIKSLLDDCQNSAANVIKKSRSLLKNTQGLLKTISHTKFSDETANMEKRKSTSCEIEFNDEECRPSTSPKKEELLRSKSSIKSIIMKTFKSSDNLATPEDNRDVPHEHKGLSLILKNCKDYRVEKIEKVRKLIPKTSLFSKSQAMSGNTNEYDNEANNAGVESDIYVGENIRISCQTSEHVIRSSDLEEEITETSGSVWIGDRGDNQLPVNRLNEDASLEEEEAEWVEEVVEDSIENGAETKFESLPAEEKPDDAVSNLTFAINYDENLPSKKMSNTTFETKAEISHQVLPPEQDDNPGPEPCKLGEMVEIPLNEPKVSSNDLKDPFATGNRTFDPLLDMEVISSVAEGIGGSRGARKWTLTLNTDLKETCSRASAKNKDKDKASLGNPSDIKKRKKNKKLTTRIRSFWLSAFGKSKSSIDKQDAA